MDKCEELFEKNYPEYRRCKFFDTIDRLVRKKIKPIFVVGWQDAESTFIDSVWDDLDLALKRWNEIRNSIIADWKELATRTDIDEETYKRVLKNLSEIDPFKMDNYPFDEPFIIVLGLNDINHKFDE